MLAVAAQVAPGALAPFEADLPLAMVGGVASTDALDQQNERVNIETLDFTGLQHRGYFNWDHKSGKDNVLGIVVEAYPVQAPDGSLHLYIKGELDLTQRQARRIYDDLRAGVKYGLSVEGDRGIEAPQPDGSTNLYHARTWAVAITRIPANPDTNLWLLKSLDVSLTGNASALRLENLAGAPTRQAGRQAKRWGECRPGANCYTHPKTGTPTDGIKGWRRIHKHMVECQGHDLHGSGEHLKGIVADMLYDDNDDDASVAERKD